MLTAHSETEPRGSLMMNEQLWVDPQSGPVQEDERHFKMSGEGVGLEKPFFLPVHTVQLMVFMQSSLLERCVS